MLVKSCTKDLGFHRTQLKMQQTTTGGETGLRLKTPSYVLLLVTGLAWLITYKQHRRHPRLHWAKCVSLHPENAPLDVDCRAFIIHYLTRRCGLIILSSEIVLLLKTLCSDIAKKSQWRIERYYASWDETSTQLPTPRYWVNKNPGCFVLHKSSWDQVLHWFRTDRAWSSALALE